MKKQNNLQSVFASKETIDLTKVIGGKKGPIEPDKVPPPMRPGGGR